MSEFDMFNIRRYADGYMLTVGISRPSNAPADRHTKADFARRATSAKKNMELATKIFPTFEDLTAEIKRLEG